MHDLARLVEHLHLLLRVVVIGEHVDMRNHVIGQLEGEFRHRGLLARADLGILRLQLRHGGGSGAAGRLVGRDMHAGDVRELLDSVQRHDHLDRRAVGVGDDAAGRILRILGIDLRHHEGHVVIHAEGARIVDHDRTVFGDRIGELLRRSGPGRGQGEVYPLEIVVVLQQFDLDLLSAKLVFASRTALGPEQHEFVDRKRPFLQNSQKFLAHSTADAHNSNFHPD